MRYRAPGVSRVLALTHHYTVLCCAKHVQHVFLRGANDLNIKSRVIASSNSFISCPKHDSALTWHRSCISPGVARLHAVLVPLRLNMPYDGMVLI